MVNLERRLAEVVKKGYPELRNIKITPEWASLPDAYMQYGLLLEESGYYIEVDLSLKNATIAEIYGWFAHECAHIVDDLNGKASEEEMKRINELEPLMIEDERHADEEAVRRGFKEQIIFAKKRAFRRAYNQGEYGLSIEEIKRKAVKVA